MRESLPAPFLLTKWIRKTLPFERVYGELREKLGTKVVPINLPIGSHTSFEGVVDLVNMKAYYQKGGDTVEAEIS